MSLPGAPDAYVKKVFHHQEYPFFRSYGANWSSSLRVDHPSALEYSSRPPVLVCGTGTCSLARGFSWQYGIKQFCHPKDRLPITPQPYVARICLGYGPNAWASKTSEEDRLLACFILLRHPIAQMATRWYRNLCACFPSPTPFGLGLGSD